jgi:hypothetical protein
MRLFKKILKITAIVFILLISLAFAAPVLFKGKILSLVKQKMNDNLEARADFKDLNLSLFRHFPKVSVEIEDLKVIGLGEFENDTLISAKTIDLALNLMSVIKGSNYTIYSVNVTQPRIHALVNKDGKANWDIAKKDSASSGPKADTGNFKLDLQHYSISNGYLKYVDASSHMSSEILNLNHEGSGDFSSESFILKTKTTADEVSFDYGGIPYLAKARTAIDADLKIDNRSNTYNFKTDDIRINDLKLSSEGLFRMPDDGSYDMDIKFNTPSNDFKDILSLVPAVYKNDFSKIKTSGKAVFNGFVKGKYSETSLPAYNVNLDIVNGFFQYPDLPKPVKNINVKMQVENKDGITDHTVVTIPMAHLEMDNDPFDFRLLVKSPVSDMFIDAAAKGKLDLSKVAQLVKLDAGTQLSGLLDADLQVNGNMSAIEKQQYDRFHAAGNLNLNKFSYTSKDYPDGVKLDELLMKFNPKDVVVSNVAGEYMKTNFSGNGTINNLLPYVMKNQTLNGAFNIKADQVNLDKWMGETEDTATAPASTTPFAVPSNINFVVNTSIDKVHYDKLDMQHVTGSLQIADETVKLNNVKADALDGTMAVNGSYSTKTSKTNPNISLTYDVKSLDVQKTFLAFNTMQKIMPIGEFLSGKLSSQLSFTGKLGQDMMPDLNSLTGQGNLLLIEGFLKKFAPVEKLAEFLNIKQLEAVSLKDVKNYIQFSNGKVLVKPFKVKVKDVDMEIGGVHGFDQSLDYTVNMKLPRSMMGEKGNQLVNNLISQVNNKGIPMKVGDMVELNVKMGGFIKNPVFKTDLKQATNSLANDFKQQATDFAKQKIDSTKMAVTTAAKDSFNSAKKQMITAAEDEIRKQLLGKKDTTTQANNTQDTKKKLEETGKGLIENINPFKKKKKQADTLTNK